jgi:hypothetical protein
MAAEYPPPPEVLATSATGDGELGGELRRARQRKGGASLVSAQLGVLLRLKTYSAGPKRYSAGPERYSAGSER